MKEPFVLLNPPCTQSIGPSLSAIRVLHWTNNGSVNGTRESLDPTNQTKEPFFRAQRSFERLLFFFLPLSLSLSPGTKQNAWIPGLQVPIDNRKCYNWMDYARSTRLKNDVFASSKLILTQWASNLTCISYHPNIVTLAN
jgi:hypothetical protein